MSRLDGLNGAALVAALVLSVLATSRFAPPALPAGRTQAATAEQALPRETLADGRQAVRDAQGGLVPLARYVRIVSLGLESDALLAELCERDRIAGVSTFQRGAGAVHLAGLPRFPGLDDLEAVIASAPDLVLVSSAADQLDRVARLRQAGLTVCNLGSQRGLASLVPNARLLGALLDADARAGRFITTLTRRLARVAATLPPDQPRRRALYLGLYGHEIYGGTTGSSYHDLLTAAGLVDAAAAQHSGWPKFSLEELIALDPDVIVLSPASATALRALPGTSALRAVAEDHLLVLDEALLEDYGPGLLDAAEALFALAYPAWAGPAMPPVPATRP